MNDSKNWRSKQPWPRFQVKNVNNVGNQNYPGTLEVADDCLKFYLRGKTSPVVRGDSVFCFSTGESSSKPTVTVYFHSKLMKHSLYFNIIF